MRLSGFEILKLRDFFVFSKVQYYCFWWCSVYLLSYIQGSRVIGVSEGFRRCRTVQGNLLISERQEMA